jgi:hypothetical protein
MKIMTYFVFHLYLVDLVILEILGILGILGILLILQVDCFFFFLKNILLGTSHVVSYSSSSSFDGPGHFFSSTTTTTGRNGVQETKEFTTDSSGKQKTVTKRKIGNRSVEVVEEKGEDQREVRHQKVKNMDIHDLNDFETQWQNQKDYLPKIEIHDGRTEQFSTSHALPGTTSRGPIIEEVNDDVENRDILNGSHSTRRNVSSSSTLTPSRVEEPEFIPTTTEVSQNIDADEDDDDTFTSQNIFGKRKKKINHNNDSNVKIQELEDDENNLRESSMRGRGYEQQQEMQYNNLNLSPNNYGTNYNNNNNSLGKKHKHSNRDRQNNESERINRPNLYENNQVHSEYSTHPHFYSQQQSPQEMGRSYISNNTNNPQYNDDGSNYRRQQQDQLRNSTSRSNQRNEGYSPQQMGRSHHSSHHVSNRSSNHKNRK